MSPGKEDKLSGPVDLQALKAKRGKHSFEWVGRVYIRLLLLIYCIYIAGWNSITLTNSKLQVQERSCKLLGKIKNINNSLCKSSNSDSSNFCLSITYMHVRKYETFVSQQLVVLLPPVSLIDRARAGTEACFVLTKRDGEKGQPLATIESKASNLVCFLTVRDLGGKKTK